MTVDAATENLAKAQEAASALARATGVLHHDVALVMGSGWVPAADRLGAAHRGHRRRRRCPGFPPPAVVGHAGRIRSIPVGDKRALVFLGRTHLYEGRGVGGDRARRAHRGRGGRPAGGADQRGRRPAAGHGVGRPGADQRSPEPDRDVPDQRRELRRPHRPVLAAAADTGQGHRPVTDGRRLRAAARTALRDPGRDPDAAHAGRGPGRHVHDARGDRGAGGRVRRSSACPSSPTSPPA